MNNKFEIITKEDNKVYISTRFGYEEKMIELDSITYIESNKRKITIHNDKEYKFEFYGKLNDLYSYIAIYSDTFIRINQSEIVNYNKVNKLESFEIILIDETIHYISRRYKLKIGSKIL